MGWKAVKEHYRIGHIVSVVDGHVAIGSPYIPDIIRIAADGSLAKRYVDGSNDELQRYQREMEADAATLRELLGAPDHFERSVPVYACAEGRVIEHYCETVGWPNVTHGGELMYENTHWPNRTQALRNAIMGAESSVQWHRKRLEDAERELARQREDLAVAESELTQYRQLISDAAARSD